MLLTAKYLLALIEAEEETGCFSLALLQAGQPSTQRGAPAQPPAQEGTAAPQRAKCPKVLQGKQSAREDQWKEGRRWLPEAGNAKKGRSRPSKIQQGTRKIVSQGKKKKGRRKVGNVFLSRALVANVCTYTPFITGGPLSVSKLQARRHVKIPV